MAHGHGPHDHQPPPGDGWQEVVYAAQLPACATCGEPWCAKHQAHYFECPCIGPTQDGYEFQEVEGVLWAREAKED